eukprot:195704-Rhodomonas_salina.3
MISSGEASAKQADKLDSGTARECMGRCVGIGAQRGCGENECGKRTGGELEAHCGRRELEGEGREGAAVAPASVVQSTSAPRP